MSSNTIDAPSTLRGSVTVFFGPMFSGKSTSLLKKILKYESAEKKVLVINYAHDTRYSDDASLCTHAKEKHRSNKCFELEEVNSIYQNYDVIAIDEGQFFHNCAEKCDEYANAGKKVFVAALDATFQRKSFNNITDIVAIAEKVVKLHAKCNSCGQKASFTQRKVNSNLVELIGGEELYEPLCRTCFKSKEDAENSRLSVEETEVSENSSIDLNTPTKKKEEVESNESDDWSTEGTNISNAN